MTSARGPEAPDPAPAGPHWYRDAVIYQLHVKSFFDGNDDGIGDFPGLLARLDYIAELGVDTLWLLPFYPSPRRDDGYDIADYLAVSPDYGSTDDLQRFIAAAHARGLRVLGDLVLNHTSEAHPWFQRARHAARDSEEHAFYVWSDDDQRYAGTRIIFPDVEKSNWTWDPVAGRYYFHRFYAHQPDLNYDNPAVLEAMLGVMRHWLDFGLDGFRLDAVAYLAEREGTPNENLPETHAVLKRLRAEIQSHYPGRVLLAEANQWPEDMKDYFGDDDECHMAFHFPLMPRMYMALAQEDRFPVTDILRQTPPTPPLSQWAIFLRNHDELTLEMVTDAERDYLWNTYAADPRARLNLGIRRRLAPLLERDRRRIELMTALLVTLPGTPVLYYGDEIGMGDNIHLGDRDGVRTPMQWSADRNGGFSRADAQRLVLPPLMDPLYGYQAVNVEAQERDPHSLLHWVRHLLRVRRRCAPLFGRGAIRFLHPRNRRVLAYLREFEGRTMLCVANLGRTLQAVELDLGGFEGRVPIDAFGGAALPALEPSPYPLTLPPYGFFLFELAGRDWLPDWYVHEPEPVAELPTLVLRGSLADELAGNHRARIDHELLQPWLRRRDWNRHGRYGSATRLREVHEAGPADGDVLLETEGGSAALAALPLTVVWDSEPDGPAAAAHALARIRRGARAGVLADAVAVPRALRGWRERWRGGEQPEDTLMRFVREPASIWPEPRGHGTEAVGEASAQQCVRLDDTLLLTVARGEADALEGPLQIVQWLSRCGNPLSLPMLGRLLAGGGVQPHPLAYAQAWRTTRGDAAQWTLDFLRRALYEYRAATDERRAELLRGYLPLARLLGMRLAELHRLLARRFGTAASPPRAAADLSTAIVQRIVHCVDAQSVRLDGEAGVPAPGRRLLLRRVRSLGALAGATSAPQMLRVHGNLSLGNIQLTTDDLYYVNFAEPATEVRAPDGHAAIRLADVADLLHALAHTAAMLDPADDGSDPLPRSFAAAFVALAQRTVLRRYRLGWLDATAENRRHERRWLRLLQVRRAAMDLETAPHPAALASAWRVLQNAVDI